MKMEIGRAATVISVMRAKVSWNTTWSKDAKATLLFPGDCDSDAHCAGGKSIKMGLPRRPILC